MKWLNEPASWHLEGERIVVRADAAAPVVLPLCLAMCLQEGNH